jgi:hypothetical protein
MSAASESSLKTIPAYALIIAGGITSEHHVIWGMMISSIAVLFTDLGYFSRWIPRVGDKS